MHIPGIGPGTGPSLSSMLMVATTGLAPGTSGTNVTKKISVGSTKLSSLIPISMQVSSGMKPNAADLGK